MKWFGVILSTIVITACGSQSSDLSASKIADADQTVFFKLFEDRNYQWVGNYLKLANGYKITDQSIGMGQIHKQIVATYEGQEIRRTTVDKFYGIVLVDEVLFRFHNFSRNNYEVKPQTAKQATGVGSWGALCDGVYEQICDLDMTNKSVQITLRTVETPTSIR